MSAGNLPSLDVLKRLVAVVRTRLINAERVLQVEMASLRKIEQEIAERQGKVGKLDEDLLDLQRFLAGDSDSAQSSCTVDSTDYQLGLKQRYWIDYDLQRERYYLDMTHDEHRVQFKKVAEARKICKAQKCKYDALFEKTHSIEQHREQVRIRKEDAERQDLFRKSVM